MFILFIEENTQDYLKYHQILDELTGKFNMDWAPNYDVALKKIENNHYDYYLVGYDATPAQHTFLDCLYQHVNTPTILLTTDNKPVDSDLLKKYLCYSIDKKALNGQSLNQAIHYLSRFFMLQKNERKFQEIFDNSLRFIAVIGLNGIVQDLNNTALHLLDLEHKAAIGLFLWNMPWTIQSQTILKSSIANIHKAQNSHFQVEIQKSKGQIITLSMSVNIHNNAVLLEGNEISGVYALEQELAQNNSHDQLTELPNRHLFMEYLEKAIVNIQKRPNATLAVLVISLDKLKSVNASLGHDMGDWLIMEITQRLQECLNKKELLARARGDEFLILQDDMQDLAETTSLAAMIIETLKRPFSLVQYEFVISSHIGIAYYTHQTEEIDLLRDAEAALSHAQAKENAYTVFRQNMYENVIAQLQMETDVLQATRASDHFVLFYQPKIELASENLVGMESMLCFQHPQYGLIPSLEFMPVLEETGFIISVGDWSLQTACQQLSSWLEMGLHLNHMSVHLSSHQFRNKNFIKTIIQAFQDFGLEPDCLEVEINESLLLESGDLAFKTLKYCKEMGVRVTLDDFGMGYASLNCLKRLPVDCLKMNSSFIDGIMDSPEDAAITVATIDMAHALGLTVTAKGVETLEQHDFLREQGCDFIQGYLYAAPMKNLEAQTWIKQYCQKN